jgi:hypothetical protein
MVLEMKSITEKDINEHSIKEGRKLIENCCDKDHYGYHLDLRDTYKDLIKTFGVETYHSIFGLPLPSVLYLSEFSIVPLRAFPLDAFVRYYGATPIQMAMLENEGLIQNILADNPYNYLQLDWFSEFVNKRYGGLPPLNRIALLVDTPEAVPDLEEFMISLRDEGVIDDIAKMGGYFSLNLIEKLLLFRLFSEEKYKAIRIALKESEIEAHYKYWIISDIFDFEIAPIIYGLGGIPNFNHRFFPQGYKLFKKAGSVNLTNDILRDILLDALNLQFPTSIEKVQDVVDFHAEGIPKKIGNALKLLIQEIKKENRNSADIEKLRSAAQEKIKMANIEYLKMCRSWKRDLVEVILEAGASASPLGFPLKSKIQEFILKKTASGSSFIGEYMILKWTLKKMEKNS